MSIPTLHSCLNKIYICFASNLPLNNTENIYVNKYLLIQLTLYKQISLIIIKLISLEY